MGTRRTDVTLRYGVNVEGIRKTSDITELYTAIRPFGRDGLTVTSLNKTEYDADGNVEFTPVSEDEFDETLTESYLTATMPSNANLTIEKIQKGGAAGEASLQITGGQRIRIPVSIKPVNISGQSAPATSTLQTATGLKGSTKFTIEGQEVNVLIAWHGTVTVTYNGGNNTATYDVTFVNPTGGEVTAPDIPGRTVTYNLTPYIGAIVDTAGRVVMDGDVPAHQLVGDATDAI